MAGWLVERGARHLLLIGRTPLPPRAQRSGLDPASPAGRRVPAVKVLEAAGAEVEVASVDVALEGPLEQCLESRRAPGAPPLRAGLAAKALGAWHLHRLLEREPLDLFVSCASPRPRSSAAEAELGVTLAMIQFLRGRAWTSWSRAWFQRSQPCPWPWPGAPLRSTQTGGGGSL
jgi:KR domain